MIEVRRAGPADAPELMRLRQVMLDDHTGGPWLAAGIRILEAKLTDPAELTVAFVAPARAGLADWYAQRGLPSRP